MELNFEINNENELDFISKEIIEKFKSKVFLFYGEMGVGKTTFIKSICKHLNVLDVVSSPTFSIVNQYVNDQDEFMYHFDFYRTNNKNEIFDIGYEEYLFSDSFCFIEWPERLDNLLPNKYLEIKMKLRDGNRVIRIKEINKL
tara:strand:- start:449 stop:877 length:429 start_codon:yes stop_codon:yes gene_type:complete